MPKLTVWRIFFPFQTDFRRIDDLLSEASFGNNEDFVQHLDTLNQYLEGVALGEADVRRIAAFLRSIVSVRLFAHASSVCNVSAAAFRHLQPCCH